MDGNVVMKDDVGGRVTWLECIDEREYQVMFRAIPLEKGRFALDAFNAKCYTPYELERNFTWLRGIRIPDDIVKTAVLIAKRREETLRDKVLLASMRPSRAEVLKAVIEDIERVNCIVDGADRDVQNEAGKRIHKLLAFY